MEDKKKAVERVKRYQEKYDIIKVRLPKGTRAVIDDLGYSASELGSIAILDYIKRLQERR